MLKYRLFGMIAALLAGILAASPATAQTNISFFNNAAFSDPFEANNLRDTLVGLGNTVTDFSGFTAADWTAAGAGGATIVIPEMEVSDLNAAMSASDRAALLAFVTGGGRLIQANYFSSNSTLPNAVFGFSLNQSGSIGATSLDATAAAGTSFAGGPATLPGSSAVEGVLSSSLPGGALNIYHDGTNSAVFATSIGAGSYVYLGFDWFEEPVSGEWTTATASALAFSSVPEPTTWALIGVVTLGTGAYTWNKRRKTIKMSFGKVK